MRIATLILALLLSATTLAPAYAFTFDNPCKAGEVFSDEVEVCVPAPKPVG